jgi:hypothetical protein
MVIRKARGETLAGLERIDHIHDDVDVYPESAFALPNQPGVVRQKKPGRTLQGVSPGLSLTGAQSKELIDLAIKRSSTATGTATLRLTTLRKGNV